VTLTVTYLHVSLFTFLAWCFKAHKKYLVYFKICLHGFTEKFFFDTQRAKRSRKKILFHLAKIPLITKEKIKATAKRSVSDYR